MKKKKPRSRVVRTSVKRKPEPAEFDLGHMVKNYFVAKSILVVLEQRGLEKYGGFFNGVIRGYNDWFEALKIQESMLNKVVAKLDKADMKKEVTDFIGKIENIENPLVVTPGVTGKQLKAFKETFDKVLRGRR